MGINSTVTLSSNGRYWQALYYDSIGKRRAKSLGPKKKLSRRQAKVACDRLAAELCLNPGRADSRHSPTLERFLDRYIDNRTDLKPATKDLYRQTKDYLLMFFDADLRIDRISRAMASDWCAAMVNGRVVLNRLSQKHRSQAPKPTKNSSLSQNCGSWANIGDLGGFWHHTRPPAHRPRDLL